MQWVAERIWWIGGTLAACFALAIAASMWLEAWADRRGARFAATHGILSRADVILPALAAAAGLPRPQVRPTVEAAPQTVITGGTHLWLGDMPDGPQAAIIRKALPGQADAQMIEGE